MLRKLFLASAHYHLCMAKKSLRTKPKEKDETFERIKKIVIIVAFIAGFAGMVLFTLWALS